MLTLKQRLNGERKCKTCRRVVDAAQTWPAYPGSCAVICRACKYDYALIGA